jgi:serine/threonine-protein phosphatase PP1 catalytic subunit
MVQLFGDIHGHFADLLWHFDSWGHPGPNAKFLFLGNYTGNGEQSLGTLCLLLAYKVKYPETFYMLRGSNETSITNNPDIVHFRNQMKKQYSSRLCDVVQECFDSLPLAAVVDEKIFAVHSGLSPELIYVEQIRSIKLPLHVSMTLLTSHNTFPLHQI